jgi:Transposase DDE domain
MSKQVLVTQGEVLGTIGDLGDSITVAGEGSAVVKSASKAALRSERIIKRAHEKAAKIVSSAKKKAASIAERAKLQELLYAEKREKKAKLLAAKVIESAEKHKAAYQVENWKAYNESLKARGEITLYLSPEVLRELKNMSKKKVVGERQYSDSLIEMCLSVHVIYGLALRQTQGFVESLLKLMGYKNAIVPDYSTICRRQGGILVNISRRFEGNEKIHMALDSTGLKVYGEGEWKVRQHGCSKRRTWMKLHIAIDVKTQEIIEVKLTDNTIHDADAAVAMLADKVEKLASFRGDGAYDKSKLREKLGAEVVHIIPPPENAVVQKSSLKKPLPVYLEQRNKAVEILETQERSQWKKDIGYHERSLNETVMFRYKTAFGGRLQARKWENQVTETLLKCKILNLFWLTGMPNAAKVV